MKYVIYSLFIFLTFTSCYQANKASEQKSALKINNTSFIDSIKSICVLNTTDTFDIKKLQTDDFSKMNPINSELLKNIYPEETISAENFFIYSILPNKNNDYLSLIIYQKNYESEGYRVDYIYLVNIDSKGNLLEKIRLSAQDNSVISYEVVSTLKQDTLTVREKISSELYSNPSVDTLYSNEYTFKLNGTKRIDTININKNSIVRKY